MTILSFQTAKDQKELESVLDAAYKTANYTNWATIDDCTKTFSIFSQTTRGSLDKYFLLYWDTSHFPSQLDHSNSYILRDGIRYYTIFLEQLSLETITKYERLRVSFRKPKCLSFGFVLVKSVRKS